MEDNTNAKGIIFTDDIRSKISEGVKKATYHNKCRYCGEIFISHTSGRKYCDNCQDKKVSKRRDEELH